MPLLEVKGCQMVLDGKIEFEIAKAIIKPASFPLLDRVVATLTENPAWKLRVEGHHDRNDNDRASPISSRRAQSVMEYVVRAGIDRARLESVGFGDSAPIADASTKAGRAKNRRVELVIVGCQP